MTRHHLRRATSNNQGASSPTSWRLNLPGGSLAYARKCAQEYLFLHTLSEHRHPQNLTFLPPRQTVPSSSPSALRTYPHSQNGKSLPPHRPVPSSSPSVFYHHIPLSPSLPVAPPQTCRPPLLQACWSGCLFWRPGCPCLSRPPHGGCLLLSPPRGTGDREPSRWSSGRHGPGRSRAIRCFATLRRPPPFPGRNLYIVVWMGLPKWHGTGVRPGPFLVLGQIILAGRPNSPVLLT